MSDETKEAWVAEHRGEQEAHNRAARAEARVEELEEKLAAASRCDALTYVKWLETRAARAEARVEELEAEVKKWEAAVRRQQDARGRAEDSHADAIRIAKDEIRRAEHAIEWAEAALARCAELEAAIVRREGEWEESFRTIRRHWDDEKHERQRLERLVHEMTPPEGHVAVMLPREDVEAWAGDWRDWTLRNRMVLTCRKALEGSPSKHQVWFLTEERSPTEADMPVIVGTYYDGYHVRVEHDVDNIAQCEWFWRRGDFPVTCSVCNDTVPSGHPCSCDDGRS